MVSPMKRGASPEGDQKRSSKYPRRSSTSNRSVSGDEAEDETLTSPRAEPTSHLLTPSMSMKKDRLQKECHKRNLNTSGTKQELLRRVEQYDRATVSRSEDPVEASTADPAGESNYPDDRAAEAGNPSSPSASLKVRATVGGLRPSIVPPAPDLAAQVCDVAPARVLHASESSGYQTILKEGTKYSKELAAKLCVESGLSVVGGKWELLGRVADMLDRIGEQQKPRMDEQRSDSTNLSAARVEEVQKEGITFDVPLKNESMADFGAKISDSKNEKTNQPKDQDRVKTTPGFQNTENQSTSNNCTENIGSEENDVAPQEEQNIGRQGKSENESGIADDDSQKSDGAKISTFDDAMQQFQAPCDNEQPKEVEIDPVEDEVQQTYWPYYGEEQEDEEKTSSDSDAEDPYPVEENADSDSGGDGIEDFELADSEDGGDGSDDDFSGSSVELFDERYFVDE